jgi:hypothetical protein
MTRAPEPHGSGRPQGAAVSDNAIAVVSAYGAFRLLLVLLAAWTVFAGFSLLTQSISALTFGADDSATERVAGAYMLILAPVYGMLAWRRDDFRLLLWIPYAAQLAVIIPLLWAIFSGDGDANDGALMLVISIIFLVLLIYVWWSSHPLDFFGPDDEEEEYDEDYDAEAEDGEDEYEEEVAVDPDDADQARRRRYRRA